MEKIIDGKTYKEVPINKMIINGKKIEGDVIPAEDTDNGGNMAVTIYTDNPEEKKVNE
jgi:hypothetical protein